MYYDLYPVIPPPSAAGLLGGPASTVSGRPARRLAGRLEAVGLAPSRRQGEALTAGGVTSIASPSEWRGIATESIRNALKAPPLCQGRASCCHFRWSCTRKELLSRVG